MENLYLLVGTIVGLFRLGLEALLILTVLFIFYQITGINLVKPIVKKITKYLLG